LKERGEIDEHRDTRYTLRNTTNQQGGMLKVRELQARTRRTRSQWVTLIARRESRAILR